MAFDSIKRRRAILNLLQFGRSAGPIADRTRQEVLPYCRWYVTWYSYERDAVLRRLNPNPMPVSPLAGKPAPKSLLVDVPKLLAAYYDRHPDPTVKGERVSFGTSGHRGTST